MEVSGFGGDKYDFSQKIVVGLIERITLRSNDNSKQKKVIARIDTGATMSSIHTEIVKELGLGPAIKAKKVKNANGITLRPVIEANINLHGKDMKCSFTVSDRTHMKYEVLIGKNILSQGFLIDPSLNFEEVIK